jgi:hypothetical protein
MSHSRQLEPDGRAAHDGDRSDDLARRDPFVMLVQRLPKMVWYGLAVLALVGAGVLIGGALSSPAGLPRVEQGTVTWVNEGLPPGGGPALFLARPDGMSATQTFICRTSSSGRMAETTDGKFRAASHRSRPAWFPQRTPAGAVTALDRSALTSSSASCKCQCPMANNKTLSYGSIARERLADPEWPGSGLPHRPQPQA